MMQEYIPFIQDNLILVIAWVALLLALVVSTIKQKTAGYQISTPSEATLLVNRHEAVMIDIRSQNEFRTGHIAGSLNLAAKEIKEGNLSTIDKHQSNPVILICKTGQTALECASHLVKAGFVQVHVLKDGLISWNEAKLPLVTGKKKK